jgi:hypothetical protein
LHRSGAEQRRRLSLTVCSTTGAVWTTDAFHDDATVGEVAATAVHHFVSEGAIPRGEYRLSLVVYG